MARVTQPPDIRLIAIDLDGTLLNSRKELDPDFADVLAALQGRGIVVAPASGRQHESIRQAVAPGSSPAAVDRLAIIAENGALVARGGRVLATDPLSREALLASLEAVAAEAALGRNVGAVLCGARSAYIERGDAEFLAATAQYYPLRQVVADLREVDDVPLKLAVWEPDGVENGVLAGIRAAAPADTRVLISAAVWVDVMSTEADKGHALARLQDELGLTPAQTMAFGDYGNDLGMLRRAEWSYAMADAHPSVRDVARFAAPSNDAQGVTRTIREVLGL